MKRLLHPACVHSNDLSTERILHLGSLRLPIVPLLISISILADSSVSLHGSCKWAEGGEKPEISKKDGNKSWRTRSKQETVWRNPAFSPAPAVQQVPASFSIYFWIKCSVTRTDHANSWIRYSAELRRSAGVRNSRGVCWTVYI